VLTEGSPSVGILPGSTNGLTHVNPMLKISCRETGHYQACRQAGEDASPDHGDSRGGAPQNRSSPDSRAVADQPRLPQRRSPVASFIAGLEGPNEMTGYVAAGVVLHFDLFRVGVVGRRQR
jgi:hypothetical protein